MSRNGSLVRQNGTFSLKTFAKKKKSQGVKRSAPLCVFHTMPHSAFCLPLGGSWSVLVELQTSTPESVRTCVPAVTLVQLHSPHSWRRCCGVHFVVRLATQALMWTPAAHFTSVLVWTTSTADGTHLARPPFKSHVLIGLRGGVPDRLSHAAAQQAATTPFLERHAPLGRLAWTTTTR